MGDTSGRSRVNEIDLLRFVAALSVMMFHYGCRGYAVGMTVMPYPLLTPVARYGHLGVNLFFMISGFVILMAAARGGLRRFMVSRAVRLYPAFWACCTLTFVTMVLFGGPAFATGWPMYVRNMTMLGGFTGVPSMDGVYWSLFIEMRFYAMVAAVLLLGQIRRAEPLIILWLAGSAAVTFHHVGWLAKLLIADYSAYFIAGAALYLVWSGGLTWRRGGVIAGS